MPLRSYPPGRMVAYLGPTNSGKTHRGIECLVASGEGVYAAPLRMLAWEGYERLAARLGDQNVGLVTGEERINEDAPITCRTAEMAPMRCKTLVLDEVQWAADPERGWAWTRLLAGCECDKLVLTGEVGALPLVRSVLGDVGVEVEFCDRLSPLTVSHKPVKLSNVPDRSVVVAFSRKAVHHVAGLLTQSGRSVAVLYGALPPEARRLQVARFVSGEAEVCVATDVIGHGVNLPCDAVYFTETSKFDGEVRRSLLPWEIAQIGGRAGRYGLSSKGEVGVVKGLVGFNADISLVKRIENPGKLIEGRPAYREVKWGLVAPTLDDLDVSEPEELAEALNKWSTSAVNALAEFSWARVADLRPLISRLRVLSRKQKQKGQSKKGMKSASLLTEMGMDDAWHLARAPLDMDDRLDTWTLIETAKAILDRSHELGTMLSIKTKTATIETLEQRARVLTALRWATLAFPDRIGGISHKQVVGKLDSVAQSLNAKLDRAVRNGIARCVSCGNICAPWFSECDECHRRRISYRFGWRDWEEEEDWDECDDDEDDENWDEGGGDDWDEEEGKGLSGNDD